MFKMSVMGGIMIVAGLVIYGFQVIGSLVGSESEWNGLCLYDVIDPDKLEWIDRLTWLGVNQALDSIASAPLYIVLPIVGGIMLAMSGFRKS